RAGANGVGGSLFVLANTNTTTALIKKGAVIYVSDVDRGLSVDAQTRIVEVSLAATTGKAKSIGASGTVTVASFINQTLAQVEAGAQITGTRLTVDAHDSTVVVNAAGSIQSGEHLGFGITATTNVLDRQTRALIGANPDNPANVLAASKINLSGDLAINARNTGALVSASFAAAIVASDPTGGQESNVASDSLSIADEESSSSAQLGGAGVGSEAVDQAS